MQYTFSYQNPLSHIIDISLQVDEITGKQTVLHLPAWRPGRYTIQNFAKNIMSLKAYNEHGKTLKVKKSGKDTWIIDTADAGSLCVSYQYYGFQMDAGNSWLDTEQLYLNFINCALYIEERMDHIHRVKILVPKNYKFATGLKLIAPQVFEAPNYYQLVDSPLVAANQLRKIKYTLGGCNFFVCIIGDLPRTDGEIIKDFIQFTKLQIEVMGGFPTDEYYFICQCLPYQHYHGVEHWNSTMITIGPSTQMAERALYKEFLGISSHELFHTWNVIRLRPIEMTPYDFKHENYHSTGFITEGVTTYYGDLFLKRSGVFTLEEYLTELNKILQRHYLNEGRKNMSVAESSYDLWLDGYEKGAPGRKVSIYNEGALLALILDLKIRLKWNNEISLDDVMLLMWEKYGRTRTGYSYNDYQNMCEEVYGEELSDYFENYVSGTTPFETELRELLENFGLEFYSKPAESREASHFGIKLVENDNRWFVDAIANDSPAEKLLSIKDEIVNYNNGLFSGSWPVKLEVNRFGKPLKVTLPQGKSSYFSVYQVKPSGKAAEKLKAWLG